MNGRIGIATCAPGANPSTIKRGRRLPYCLLLIALLLGAALIQRDGGAGFPAPQPRSTAQWAHLYGALPLSFEANRGQTDPSVSFLARGRGYTLFLTGREAVLTLQNPSSSPSGPKLPDSVATLRLQLAGANPHAIVTGGDELPGKANYFIGNVPSEWHTDVPTYAKVRYGSIYPGIDLVYYGTQGGELEYDFLVAPGADPQVIALAIQAQEHTALRINAEGGLVVHLPDGDVQLHKPVVYQETKETRKSNHRQLVEGHYALDAQNRVRFELGPYDHQQPLVIDPVLAYATYVGGSGGDIGYAIAVDSSLDAYIAGLTNSTNFPALNGNQSSSRGNGDGFITKINSGGTALIFSTYLGGSGTDAITALAESSGSSFVTGYTTSTDFPIKAPTSGSTPTEPFQQTYGGNTDAFVTQLDTTGKILVYSSYLGGNGLDQGQGIAVDSSGNAYVTGTTQSSNFPIASTAPNTPLQSSIGASQNNAFVTEVNFSGEALIYSTFLGGPASTAAQSIQIDSSGNAYIAGYVLSGAFPTVAPIQSASGGGADAFVAKLNPAGSALVYATYLGGSGDDRAYGLALDGSQNAYVVGTTTSPNFPVVSPAWQSTLKGASNAFVSKLNAAGSALVYSTYLGGSDIDQGTAIAVTSAGVAYVTGFTESTDFPTQNAIQSVLGLSNNNFCGTTPCADAFVTQFNAAGNALTYSTFLGGNGPDFGQAIAVDSTGDPYITGSTSSINFPVASPPNSSTTYVPPYKSTLTGTAGNAFIAKIDSGNNPNISIEPGSLNFGNETITVPSPIQQITIVNPSTVALTISQIQIKPIGQYTTIFTETDNCVGTVAPNGGYCTINVTFTPASTTAATTEITLTDDAGGVAGTQQTITLSGSGVTAATAVQVLPTSLSFTSQAVGTSSAPQNVTITNTGTSTLNISKISAGTTGDFSETDTCGAVQDTLAVNQSCTISVVFSPTASGTRSGSLTISDNATGSPQAVSLTGIGAAAFTLVSPPSTQDVNPVLIGSTQTTFLIEAQTGSNFNGAISLSCPSTNITCSFATNPFFAGQTSLLTISNLTTTLSNPYQFTVTGTSGSQTNSLQINLEFQDFTLSATPSLDTITAGTTASYQLLVNPLYGFSKQVQLICLATGLPPAATCNFSNSTPTPNGTSPASVTLNITTEKYVAPQTHAPPRTPSGKLPPLIFGLLSLAALASLALGNRRGARNRWLSSSWLWVRLATLSLILALNLALVTCRPSTLVISGTTTGGYTITIQGELVSNTAVLRTTTLALSVTQSPP